MIIKPAILNRVLDLAIHLQQIPAPTFEEEQRAEFIQRCFMQHGAEDVQMDEWMNVYARLKGRSKNPPVVVSAHLDTVFPRGTDLAAKRTLKQIYGPGIGDNSLGLAGLFGLLWALTGISPSRKSRPPLGGDVWLVANVGEEGLGNLQGMKAVVNRFQGDAQAYIVLEGMSLGHIYHRGLCVSRYNIGVHTRGGHSWVDYGSPSAIHELADLVVKINELDIPSSPRASLNIGVISGGTSVNTIAAEAHLELDLRSESAEVLDGMKRQVEGLVEQAKMKGGEAIRVEASVIGERPAGEISPAHPLVRLARECLEANGIQPRLNIGSTDANEPLSRGLPAICVGLTTGGGVHTLGEFIDIEPVQRGLGSLVDLVRSLLA